MVCAGACGAHLPLCEQVCKRWGKQVRGKHCGDRNGTSLVLLSYKVRAQSLHILGKVSLAIQWPFTRLLSSWHFVNFAGCWKNKDDPDPLYPQELTVLVRRSHAKKQKPKDVIYPYMLCDLSFSPSSSLPPPSHHTQTMEIWFQSDWGSLPDMGQIPRENKLEKQANKIDKFAFCSWKLPCLDK